jgi:hypothetical protein
MTSDNPKNIDILLRFIKRVKRLFRRYRRKVKLFLKNRPINTDIRSRHVIQRIQLTFIYFFAIVVLSYSTIGYLGEFPLVFDSFPAWKAVLKNPIIALLNSNEVTFSFCFVIIQLLNNRSRYAFSTLLKYNILLIFLLEMCQNTIVLYCDMMAGEEIEIMATAKFAGDFPLVNYFYIFFYFVCLAIYLWCYARSFTGHFPVFTGPARVITNSVAIWLKLRRPKNKK